MDRERARITDFDEELQSLDNILRSKNTICSEGSLTLQKLRHEVEKYNKEEQSSHSAVSQLESEYEWISDAKEDFGKRGTPYDFHGQNISECKNALRQLSERFASMKRKVNPKVMGMIDSVEKKETALKNMLRTVIKDKAKIEETILSLDEYKKEALHRTWEKVNGYKVSFETWLIITRDFGQIFAELLPGNFAKLEPPEGKDVTEGLEVKVCLGKVWKQSLTELSGGQRYS
jgi:structural maintenance of chromosome 2